MRLAFTLNGWIGNWVPEFTRFAVVGAAAFVISDGGSNLLRFQAGLGPLTSNTVATVAATLFAFLGNRYWTFRHRQQTAVGREGVQFFLLNGVGLLIQLAVIAFTSYLLGLTGRLAYNVALVVGIGLGTLFRFWSYRRWIWRAQPRALAGPASPAAQDHPVTPAGPAASADLPPAAPADPAAPVCPPRPQPGVSG